MLKTNELSEMRRINEIEQRLATATTNREQNLIAKSSASKKRILTPRGSPTSRTQIEEKVCIFCLLCLVSEWLCCAVYADQSLSSSILLLHSIDRFSSFSSWDLPHKQGWEGEEYKDYSSQEDQQGTICCHNSKAG